MENHSKTTGSFWCLIDWGPAKDAEASRARKCREHYAVAVLQLIWKNYPNHSLGLNNLQHLSVLQASSSKCFKVKTCSKSQIHVYSIYACACMCRRNTQHQITAKAAAKFLQNKPTNQPTQNNCSWPGLPLPPAPSHSARPCRLQCAHFCSKCLLLVPSLLFA